MATGVSTEFYSDLENSLPGKVVNIDSVKQAIFNLLNTTPGERIFEPELGVEIESLLFEPGDPIFLTYAESILNELFRQEPRITRDNVSVDFVYDQNTAKLNLRVIVIRPGIDEGSAEIRIPIE
jgi:phage baseplate assembly protein W